MPMDQNLRRSEPFLDEFVVSIDGSRQQSISVLVQQATWHGMSMNSVRHINVHMTTYEEGYLA